MAITQLDRDINFLREEADVISATVLSNTSDAFELWNWQQCVLQVVHDNHAATTTTFALQASVDGVNFDTITGSATTTAGNSGSNSVNVSNIAANKIRIIVTNPSGNAGATLKPFFQAKNGR